MTSAVEPEEAPRDEDMWDTLPQSIPRPRSCAQSSELLDLGDDHEMGFEAAPTPSPRYQSPVRGAGSTPSSPSSERPRRCRKVRSRVMIFHVFIDWVLFHREIADRRRNRVSEPTFRRQVRGLTRYGFRFCHAFSALNSIPGYTCRSCSSRPGRGTPEGCRKQRCSVA